MTTRLHVNGPSATRFIAIAIISLAAASALHGQAVRRMTTVRLVTSSGEVQGRVDSSDSSQIRLRTGSEFHTYQRADVSAAFRPVRQSKRGAKVGLIAGSLLGGLFVASIANMGDCYNDCHEATNTFLGLGVGAILGGGLGAGVGALAGSSTTRWIPISDLNDLYRRP